MKELKRVLVGAYIIAGCMMVLFLSGCGDGTIEEKVPDDLMQTVSAINSMRCNQPGYDYMKDEFVPSRLKERINALIVAFNTGDSKGFCNSYDIKGLYEVITGKINKDDFQVWESISPEQLKKLKNDLDKRKITTFEEYYQASVNLFDYAFSVADTKYEVSCVEVLSDKAYLYLVNDSQEKMEVEFNYYCGEWWLKETGGICVDCD